MALNSLRTLPLRVSVTYLVASLLWILCSDLVVDSWPDHYHLPIQTLKGWLFVLLTSGLIYGLLKSPCTHAVNLSTQLERTEAQAHRLIENLDAVVFRCDRDGNLVYVSESCERVLDLTKDKMRYRSLSELLTFDQDLSKELFRLRESTADYLYLNGILNSQNNNVVIRCSFRVGEEGDLFEGMMQDISEDVRLRNETLLAAKVFEGTSEGICITDADSKIIAINKAFSRITGYTEEEVIGKTPAILHSNRQSEQFYDDMWKQILLTGSWQGEVWNQDKYGNIYPEWLHINALQDRVGCTQHYVGTFSDISRIKRIEGELEHLANYDPLTGLPNREFLHSRMKHKLEEMFNRKCSFAGVIYIDLDAFQSINEVFGPKVGDQILKISGNRIRDLLREEDIVSRLSGDEYCVFIPNVLKTTHVETIAEKIMSALHAPLTVHNKTLEQKISVGIAVAPRDGTDFQDLIVRAETAMFSSKAAGGGKISVYEPKMKSSLEWRYNTSLKLRTALEMNEFEVFYQLQRNYHHGAPSNLEALIRWRHEGKLISPDEFIPLAEDTGQIIPIGYFVIETACMQAVTWHQQRKRFGRIAINISASQLQDSKLLEYLKETFNATGCDPHWIELEITETVVMEKSANCLGMLAKIKELGIQLSIDDFGTGYSSLSYLKDLPFDILKIDKSFIDGIGKSTAEEQIIRAIHGIADGLGLTTVAEGVESEEQEDFLIELGIDYGQGYFYNRPLNAASIEHLL